MVMTGFIMLKLDGRKTDDHRWDYFQEILMKPVEKGKDLLHFSCWSRSPVYLVWSKNYFSPESPLFHPSKPKT